MAPFPEVPQLDPGRHLSSVQSPVRWTLAIEATISLIWGRLLCNMPIARWLRLARLQTASLPESSSRFVAAPDPELRAVARHLDGAARRVPWRADCLPKALAAMRMLERRGYQPMLYLGARLGPAATSASAVEMNAHAWVMCDGVMVSGEQAHAHYVPVTLLTFTARGAP